MKALVKKWGNSAAVRIRSSLMRAARLDLDQLVDVYKPAETDHG